MVKNSFTLFETILALIIILILVSGFSKFTYPNEASSLFIHNIKNSFILNQSGQNINIQEVGYSVNNSMIILNNHHQILHKQYQDNYIKIEQYEFKIAPTQTVRNIEVE